MKSKLKLQQQFKNVIISDEKDINDKTFSNYVKYQKQLLKELIAK